MICPSDFEPEDPYVDNFDDEMVFPEDDEVPLDVNEMGEVENEILFESKNGIVYKVHQNLRIIHYVNYNVKVDPENHFHEQLMLFLPWRNEETELLGNCASYLQHYIVQKNHITEVHKKYEWYNDILSDAIDMADQMGDNDDDDDDGEDGQGQDIGDHSQFAFFDPDCEQQLRQHDIGVELGVDVNQYDTEIDSQEIAMTDEDYADVMRKLNLKQYELVIHVVEQLLKDGPQMFIFLEGGAGVGKMMCA